MSADASPPAPAPTRRVLWKPNPGPQTAFLAADANEVLYGGAAAGGKSAGLIACPARWAGNPNYRGLYLRRTATYLGDAVDKSLRIYPHLGAKLVRSPRIEWHFPSGAQLWMGHCQTPADIANYDSFEFSEVLFDELTHFEETMYRGIRARIRGTDPTLPYWSRAATKPGGRGHEWVFRRFAAWLDPTHERPAKPGEVRWFVGDREVERGTRYALSRTFIPARRTDNPYVSDEQYGAQLQDLTVVRRKQLDEGDWTIKPGGGAYFHRDWWKHYDEVPGRIVRSVRWWDLGATVDGDPSRGVLLHELAPGAPVPYVWSDLRTVRGTPGDVRAAIKATAEADTRRVAVGLPLDPGQAGEDQRITYVDMLRGWEVLFRRPQVSKELRAKAPSSQVQNGRVAILRRAWAHEAIDEMHDFPDGDHDDIVDAFDDGMAHLMTTVAPPEPEAPQILDMPPPLPGF